MDVVVVDSQKKVDVRHIVAEMRTKAMWHNSITTTMPPPVP